MGKGGGGGAWWEGRERQRRLAAGWEGIRHKKLVSGRGVGVWGQQVAALGGSCVESWGQSWPDAALPLRQLDAIA